MSAFEDEFEIPAASEVDPAAEFLAKEQVKQESLLFTLTEMKLSQEELGDIGEDLGISGSTDQPIVAEAHQETFGATEDEVGNIW